MQNYEKKLYYTKLIGELDYNGNKTPINAAIGDSMMLAGCVHRPPEEVDVCSKS